MRRPPPGLVVAAPRSGSGKTTLTLGLLAAFRRAGRAVASVKAGPDYIDPAFHAAATGRPAFNLDTWAMGADLLDAVAAEAGRGADLVVCEGLMGLFDGVAPGASGDGSTAALAARFGWPVVLVLDVAGQSQSAGAIAKGFAAFRPDVTVAGIVLNNVGSPRHADLCRRGIAEAGLPVFGALPRRTDLAVPERHLGLVQAEEIAGLEARIAAIADHVAAHVDLDAVAAAAASRPRSLSSAGAAPSPPRGEGWGEGTAFVGEKAPSSGPPGHLLPEGEKGGVAFTAAGEEPTLPPSLGSSASASRTTVAPSPLRGEGWGEGTVLIGEEAPSSGPAGHLLPASGAKGGVALPAAGLSIRPPGRRIALARDAAFSFVYGHLIHGWRAAGAEIVPFSPLADEPPPEDCDLCWLPGGYPELHAGRLAAAQRFHDGLRTFATTRPVHGECGGYMVLGQALVDAEGVRHPMAGLLGLETSFARRKLHLGYRRAVLAADGPLGAEGQALRGHEFHYASVLDTGGDAPFATVTDANGTDLGPAGTRRGTVSGTFFHMIGPG